MQGVICNMLIGNDIDIRNYKKLTQVYKNNNDVIIIPTYGHNALSYDEILQRLGELECMIANGDLVQVNKPFYSDIRQGWCVHECYNDVINTCCITAQQAANYKK